MYLMKHHKVAGAFVVGIGMVEIKELIDAADHLLVYLEQDMSESSDERYAILNGILHDLTTIKNAGG